MSDEELRKREREAAVGGPEDQAKFEAARDRTETPEEALDRRLSELRAGMTTSSEGTWRQGRDTHTFANGVVVTVTRKGYSQGETQEDIRTVTFDGRTLTTRQYDTDHVSEESLEFDGATIYEHRATAADMNASPRRSGSRAAAGWANRLLTALDLPLGRGSFERLLSKLFSANSYLCGHVFQGVPDGISPS